MAHTGTVVSGCAAALHGRPLYLEDEGDVIQHYLDKIFPVMARRTLAPFRYSRWLRWAGNRQVDVAMERLMEVVDELVSKARARVHRQRQTPSNLLEAMVSANSNEASAFTDDEIAGNILIMFLAGEETTANTLAWMMHPMAEHPEVQCQMQTEAHEVLREAERPPTFESLSALRYASREIRRALVSALDDQALHDHGSGGSASARPGAAQPAIN